MGERGKKKQNSKKPTKKDDAEKTTVQQKSSQGFSLTNKKFLIVLSCVIILIIIGIVFLWQFSQGAAAQLLIDSGIVEVKTSGGQWIAAENGMDLYQSDSVKTGENSSASIILYKNSIIRLDSNTKVTLTEIIEQAGDVSVSTYQDSGRTWNTIRKISGIDNYEVQTPSAVASVRGTSFFVKVYNNGSSEVGVGQGAVNVSRSDNETTSGTIKVDINESVFIDPNKKDKPLGTKPWEIDDWILQNQQMDAEELEELKQQLYARIEEYIPELKEEYEFTDEELDVLIEGYLLGYYDLPPETPPWIRDIIEGS